MSIVTADNWVIIDRILDGTLGGAVSNRITPARRYVRGDEARDAWSRLPRWEMADGKIDLSYGLQKYNAWVAKFVSPASQVTLAVDAMVEAAEAASTAAVVTVGFGIKSCWLHAAAAREGVGVNEFVRAKLAPTVLDERERYRNERLRNGLLGASTAAQPQRN